MSDAAVSDTAGPSTFAASEIEQELKNAELNFQQGIQAIKVGKHLRTVLSPGAHALLICCETLVADK